MDGADPTVSATEFARPDGPVARAPAHVGATPRLSRARAVGRRPAAVRARGRRPPHRGAARRRRRRSGGHGARAGPVRAGGRADGRRPGAGVRRGAARGARRLRTRPGPRRLRQPRLTRDARHARCRRHDRRRARRADRGRVRRPRAIAVRAAAVASGRRRRALPGRPARRPTTSEPRCSSSTTSRTPTRARSARALARSSSTSRRRATSSPSGRRHSALADEIVELLRDRPGVAAITASADLLLLRLDIVDVAVAPYMTGQIVLGRSSRGLLGPDMVTVAAHAPLAEAVRDGDIGVLTPQDAAALGAPEGLGALDRPRDLRGRGARPDRAAVRRHARRRRRADADPAPASAPCWAWRSCRSACSATSPPRGAEPQALAVASAASTLSSTSSRSSRPVIARVLAIDRLSFTSTRRPSAGLQGLHRRDDHPERRRVHERRRAQIEDHRVGTAVDRREQPGAQLGRAVEVQVAAGGHDEDVAGRVALDDEAVRHRGGANVTISDSPRVVEDRTATPSEVTARRRASPP